MKSIKKIFLLLFAVSVIFSMSAAYAEENDVIARNEYNINTLTGLGIIDDFKNESLSETVTRYDFACMLANMMCEDLPSADYSMDKVFNDVNRFTDGYNELYYLYSKNIISGKNDGGFYPEDVIQPAEVYAMTLRAMGYSDIADFAGGYPNGYNSIAGDLKLSVRSSANGITYEDMFEYLVDVLTTSVMDIEGTSGGNISISNTSETTFLEYFRDITCIDGIMTENMITGLFSSQTLIKSITVGDYTISCQSHEFDKYIGMYVRAYCYEDDGEYELKFVVPKPNKSKELIIDKRTEPELDSGYIKYYEGSKQKRIKINENPDILVNDVAYNGFMGVDGIFAGIVDDNDIVRTYDMLRFVDTDGDAEYDVIFVTVYEDILPNIVSAENYTVYDKITGNKYSFEDVSENLTVYKEDGSIGEFSDIEKNKLISVARSYSAGNDYCSVYIAPNPINGTVSGIDNEGVTIDSTFYYVEDAVLPSIDMGLARTFYVNAINEIVYVGYLKDDKYNLAILSSAKEVEEAGDKEVLIKIFENEDFRKFFCREKVKLNNTTYKISNDEQRSRFLANCEANTICGYVLNDEGFIIELVTPTDSDDSYFKELSVSNPNKFQYAGNVVNGEFLLLDSALIYSVPGNGGTDEEEYYTVNRSGFGDSTYSKKYNVYALDKNNEIPNAEIMVIEDFGSTVTVEPNDPFAIVLGKGAMLAEDDEVYDSIEVFVDGTIKTYPVKSDTMLDDYDINIGDVIAFSTDAMGRITMIETRLRADGKRGECELNVPDIIPGVYENNKPSHNSPGVYSYGEVTAVSETYVAYSSIPLYTGEVPAKTTRVAPLSGRNKPFIYDKETNVAKVGTYADISPEDKIIVLMSQAAMRNIVVIKN